MNEPGAVPPGSRGELELWRNEVREFCEDTLRQLQQLSSMLDSELQGNEPRAGVSTDTVSRMETQTLDLPIKPKPADEPVDSSRSRLENLKRQLSEKLRQTDRDADS